MQRYYWGSVDCEAKISSVIDIYSFGCHFNIPFLVLFLDRVTKERTKERFWGYVLSTNWENTSAVVRLRCVQIIHVQLLHMSNALCVDKGHAGSQILNSKDANSRGSSA